METHTGKQPETASASQNGEQGLWQEIKNADTYGNSEYRSRLGLVAWWPKDGGWHVALACPDPDPVTKLKTGGFRWTEILFPNPESAMVAVDRGEIPAPTPANPAHIKSESAHTPELLPNGEPDYRGEVQRLKYRLSETAAERDRLKEELSRLTDQAVENHD